MAHPLGPPPQPLAGCQPRTLPRALRGLPTCLQHSRGSRPEGAGAPARATRGQAPGRGRRPSPGQRRTPGRPAASPGQPPYPRRSAHLAGKWSLSSAGGVSGVTGDPARGEWKAGRREAKRLLGSPSALQVRWPRRLRSGPGRLRRSAEQSARRRGRGGGGGGGWGEGRSGRWVGAAGGGARRGGGGEGAERRAGPAPGPGLAGALAEVPRRRDSALGGPRARPGPPPPQVGTRARG